MMPALFTRMWRGRPDAENRAANASTDCGSIKSRLSISTRSMPVSAARALSGVRAGTITVAPAAASVRVVSSPMPA